MSLVIALPSKGRLQENATAFFARAGLSLVQARGERDYRGAISGLESVELRFLSASEIAGRLAAGEVHLGVTGEDLIHERLGEPERVVDRLLRLGFGPARVVVAVPASWIDVESMADLDDLSITFRQRHGRILRVATKYVALTRRFFARHALAEFRDYRIVESAGATEGAPAAGTADLIVDITTSGATLAANGLRVLSDGLILDSQACLFASLRAEWDAAALAAAEQVFVRIEAEMRADGFREVRVEPGASDQMELAAILGVEAGDGGELVAHVPAAETLALAERCRAAGARRISIVRLEALFSATSPLVERLRERLSMCRVE